MVDQKDGVRVLPVIGLILIVLLVLAALSVYAGAQQRARADAAKADTASLAGIVSALPADGRAAISGESGAFGRLATSAQQARALASGLNALASVNGLGDILDNADLLAAASEPVLRAHAAAGEIDTASGGIGRTVVGLSDVAPAASRGILQDTARTARRVAIEARSLLGDSVAREETARLLGDDELRLGQLIMGLSGQDSTPGVEPLRLEGREAQITELVDLHERINGAVLTTISNSAEYASAQETAAGLVGQSALVAKRLANLDTTPPAVSLGPLDLANPWFAAVLLVIAALLAVAATWLSFSGEDTRRAAERQNRQNERNQAAILRLLDELGSLADGDLTVQATVTEDITGAIADSINYAIEALRELGRNPLVIKKTRFDTIYGLQHLMDSAYASADNYTLKTLVVYGHHDEIIPKEPVLDAYKRFPAESKKLILYENGYHMLLRDLQAEIVMQDIITWIND